ncbi:MAG: hypothetical protein ACREA9_23765 [Pyrinomonadaceae bacterium]
MTAKNINVAVTIAPQTYLNAPGRCSVGKEDHFDDAFTHPEESGFINSLEKALKLGLMNARNLKALPPQERCKRQRI